MAAAAGRAGTDGATGLGKSLAACSGFGLVKNGAGCDPDCRNTAFVMMSRLAAAANSTATESTGRAVALVHRSPASAPPAPVARA